ncbi:1,4-dihydroxy-2-naphthoate octaprenyltransferase [bacterium]|nr:1,4-dihydroxy-2-naphthoate octaprenyltransferase [bacterium]
MARYPFPLWLRASRPFSFTASATPILLGTALAFYQTGHVDVIMFVAALLGGVLLHAGTNLISDYFDYSKGVDREETYGGSRILVEKTMQPKDVLTGGLIAFGLAFLIGVYLVWSYGWPIVMFGLAGIAGGYFYTAGPVGYKYRALGEFLVFTLMGPLMVWGAHFVQVGELQWMVQVGNVQIAPLLVSLPVGILVAAILFANNLRDIEDDNESGYHTQASLLGRKKARIVYAGFLYSAYLVLVALVVFKMMPIWALLPFISIPAALKVNKVIQESLKHDRGHLAMVDVMTAQLHFQFGILLTIGIVIGYWV